MGRSSHVLHVAAELAARGARRRASTGGRPRVLMADGLVAEVPTGAPLPSAEAAKGLVRRRHDDADGAWATGDVEVSHRAGRRRRHRQRRARARGAARAAVVALGLPSAAARATAVAARGGSGAHARRAAEGAQGGGIALAEAAAAAAAAGAGGAVGGGGAAPPRQRRRPARRRHHRSRVRRGALSRSAAASCDGRPAAATYRGRLYLLSDACSRFVRRCAAARSRAAGRRRRGLRCSARRMRGAPPSPPRSRDVWAAAVQVAGLAAELSAKAAPAAQKPARHSQRPPTRRRRGFSPRRVLRGGRRRAAA